MAYGSEYLVFSFSIFLFIAFLLSEPVAGLWRRGYLMAPLVNCGEVVGYGLGDGRGHGPVFVAWLSCLWLFFGCELRIAFWDVGGEVLGNMKGLNTLNNSLLG